MKIFRVGLFEIIFAANIEGICIQVVVVFQFLLGIGNIIANY